MNALELAETLEKNYGHLMAEAQAAAELRRLVAINAELLKTLEQILAIKPQTGMNPKAKGDDPIEIKVGWNVHMIARTALEKAKQ